MADYNIRDVTLETYLPSFMQKYKEPMAALTAMDPEFKLVWERAERAWYNHFVSTADSYGISRYEAMFGIHPTSEDTLESRRARVAARWAATSVYTWKALLERLDLICGAGNYTISHNFGTGYSITLETSLDMYGQVAELESVIRSWMPGNMFVISNNSIKCESEGAVYAGGGEVATQMYEVSCDYVDTVSATAPVKTGGGVVFCNTVEIS